MCKSGKVRHKTREGAIITLKKLKNAGLSAYPCKMCGGWHLGNSSKGNKVQSRIDQLLSHHARLAHKRKMNTSPPAENGLRSKPTT